MKNSTKYYQDYWNKRNYKKWEWRFKVAFDFIKPSSRVLDIGCGDGTFGQNLIQLKKCKVTGIDISEEAIAQAQKKGLRAYVFDIEKDKWPFLKEDFDYVVALEVLEHLFRPQVCLEKIRKITKYAIFSYANTCFWRNRFEILKGRVPIRAPFRNGEHLWYWSYKGFKDFFRLNNFEIIDERLSVALPILDHSISGKTKERIAKHFFPNFFTYGICLKTKVLK